MAEKTASPSMGGSSRSRVGHQPRAGRALHVEQSSPPRRCTQGVPGWAADGAARQAATRSTASSTSTAAEAGGRHRRPARRGHRSRRPVAQADQAFNWTALDALIPYALALLVFGITMAFAGRLQDKYGPRLIATIGGVFVGAGMILASFTDMSRQGQPPADHRRLRPPDRHAASASPTHAPRPPRSSGSTRRRRASSPASSSPASVSRRSTPRR